MGEGSWTTQEVIMSVGTGATDWGCQVVLVMEPRSPRTEANALNGGTISLMPRTAILNESS